MRSNACSMQHPVDFLGCQQIWYLIKLMEEIENNYKYKTKYVKYSAYKL